MQVTADGVPVIWHDDYVITRSADGALAHRFIAQLTLAEFKRLALPQRVAEAPRVTSGDTPGSAGPAEGHTRVPEDPSESSRPAKALAGGEGQTWAVRGARGEELVRLFHDSDGRRMRAAEPWAVEADDDLPTLAEVFKVQAFEVPAPAFVPEQSMLRAEQAFAWYCVVAVLPRECGLVLGVIPKVKCCLSTPLRKC